MLINIIKYYRGRLQILFPRTFSPAMIRDGIPQEAPRKNLNHLHTQQLTHLVSTVPLEHWTSQWPASITDIIDSISHCKWPRTMLNGLTIAAVKQQNQTWIKALLVKKSFSSTVARLLRVIEHETLQNYILENKEMFEIKESGLARDQPMYAVLQFHREPWNEALSIFWLEQFATYIVQTKARKSIDMQIKAMLSRLLGNTPVTLLDFATETLTAVAAENPHWRAPIEQMLKAMRFRQTMLADIYG